MYRSCIKWLPESGGCLLPPLKGNSKQQTVHEERPAARFSDRGSIPLGSTKKEGTRESAFFFFAEGESNGLGVNDVPGARQSQRDLPAGESDSPRIHQKSASVIRRLPIFTSSLFTLHSSLFTPPFPILKSNSESCKDCKSRMPDRKIVFFAHFIFPPDGCG